MLTKNYKKWLTHVTGDKVNTRINYKFVDGTEATTTMANSTSLGFRDDILTTQTSTSTLYVGTGTTSASAEDFKLENIVETNLTAVSAHVYMTDDNLLLEKIFTYSGAETIAITEIGLYKKVVITSSGAYKNLCFAREVLNTPIMVTNGDTFTVTMAIG